MNWLRPAAHAARFTSALAVFVASGAFSFNSAKSAWQHQQQDSATWWKRQPRRNQTARPAASSPTAADALAQKLPPGIRPDRPDRALIEQLMQGEGTPDGQDAKQLQPPAAQIRRIVVDMGPPRSTVYLDGLEKGRTPYVGQISCIVGSSIKIEVLPQSGAPITRSVNCGADNIHAGPEPPAP